MRGTELDRIEVRLSEVAAGAWRGYLRVGDELRALPAGSHLAPDGTFTWQPGVGFVGEYDLVFVTTREAGMQQRREVRVTLAPGR